MAFANVLTVLSYKLRALGMRHAVLRACSILRRDGVAGVRRRLHDWAAAGGARAERAERSPITRHAAANKRSGGINLVGHPYGALGMGEHIRKSAQAFAAADVPFTIFNTFDQPGAHADKFPEFPLHDRISRAHPYAASLFHMNADEMKLASAHLGAGFFENRYNIGYWAWELAKFPDAWTSAFAFFDEIWAPSRFIQQAVAEKAPCPVVHMPLAVDFHSDRNLPRAHFGLPEHRYLFLFFFDFTSYVTRKNPLGALAAFRTAFASGRKDVALVIKVNGTEQKAAEYRRFLEQLGEGDPSIVLIDRVMTDHEVRNLVRNCNAFVSLHRSEGFGRGLAEAMFYGKAVVGTAYSGNLDFMNPDNACLVDASLIPVRQGEYPFPEGQSWADPDVEQAAHYMRRLVANPAWGDALGRRASAYMRTHHSFGAIGARYRDRLVRLGLLER